VPEYLPELAKAEVRWARRHVLRVSLRYGIDLRDLWDESVAALLRAALHYEPTMGRFNSYAQTAVHRACWRYVVRPQRRRQTPVVLGLTDADGAAPSPEDWLIAQETVADRPAPVAAARPVSHCGARCGPSRATSCRR